MTSVTLNVLAHNNRTLLLAGLLKLLLALALTTCYLQSDSKILSAP